jgi:hypothetical protein
MVSNRYGIVDGYSRDVFLVFAIADEDEQQLCRMESVIITRAKFSNNIHGGGEISRWTFLLLGCLEISPPPQCCRWNLGTFALNRA